MTLVHFTLAFTVEFEANYFAVAVTLVHFTLAVTV